MFIYSKNILQFTSQIVREIKTIISQEIGLRVEKHCFYERFQFASYPIQVVIYNNKSMLGYFDSDFYELGFHESLRHAHCDLLRNVIRHELAHYLTFIQYGKRVQAHGPEFKEFCRQRGWGPEVYQATFLFDRSSANEAAGQDGILRKVQKLMALSTSSNQHEAEQAMIKSRQLLLKHNLEAHSINSAESEELVVLARVLKQSKEDAKMRAIAKILETFFVYAVFNRTEGYTHLEIIGSPVNVEIAEYVSKVLVGELDRLWAFAREQNGLQGLVAKNSFFLGLSLGYCNKIRDLQRQYSPDVSHALMVIENKLADAKQMVYKRLVTAKAKGQYCSESSKLGEKMGKELTINPALNSGGKRSGALIGHNI